MMTPREFIDRLVFGSFRHHAAELERQILIGCQECGAPLVRDGQVIDAEATAFTMRGDKAIMICRKCCCFDEAIPIGFKAADVQGMVTEWGVEQLKKAADNCPDLLRGTGMEVLSPGTDDILVWHYPAGDEGAKTAILESLKGNKFRSPSLLMPSGFNADVMPLSELRHLRDRLNEVIYDKEHASQK